MEGAVGDSYKNIYHKNSLPLSFSLSKQTKQNKNERRNNVTQINRQGADESFVMASEAKILPPIIDESPLFTVMRSCFFKPGKILLVGWNERRPNGDDAFRK